MYLLGYDVGSSSVKASIVDAQTGACVASAFYPKQEAPIIAHHAGWSEQDPNMWWNSLKEATQKCDDNQRHPSGRLLKPLVFRIRCMGLSVSIKNSKHFVQPLSGVTPVLYLMESVHFKS